MVSSSRTSAGRERLIPAAARINSCSAPRLSGPSGSRISWPGGNAPSRPAAAAAVRSVRTDASSRTGSSSNLRRTNSRARADGRSSHWRSSIAIVNGRERASSLKAVNDANATARGSGSKPSRCSRRSATSRACSCGAGNSAATTSRTPSRRSRRPANASRTSALPGRATSTVRSRSRDIRTPSRHRLVLPIPGSPSISSARATPESKKRSISASSPRRPSSASAMRRGYASGATLSSPAHPRRREKAADPTTRGLQSLQPPAAEDAR